ncbi:hypothetical protein A3A03_01385 [Candidatus Nomurabacteria bacterium RIFCSPLOWO2_01_FULL_40_18]|uniref:Uncharacterized protein n=1 Tax=Candidatus Nomurabacteria bacterium RIFCSPLOWO2_01_FULL_40_18 TaxID=1801773 RepID=A0A1F6XI66_9BACT|nr:MAG: hypothetical protein A3A03_01385 [Candidatus Nomurabacteria bacterium RIFCSPLOWO2_01_FULL_40_18]
MVKIEPKKLCILNKGFIKQTIYRKNAFPTPIKPNKYQQNKGGITGRPNSTANKRFSRWLLSSLDFGQLAPYLSSELYP